MHSSNSHKHHCKSLSWHHYYSLLQLKCEKWLFGFFICIRALQVVSSWFRLYLYKAASDGPISLYIPKGIRFTVIPKQFRRCKRVILTTASHEPVIVPVDSCLVPLNDTLQTHAVLMQVSTLPCVCLCRS